MSLYEYGNSNQTQFKLGISERNLNYLSEIRDEIFKEYQISHVFLFYFYNHIRYVNTLKRKSKNQDFIRIIERESDHSLSINLLDKSLFIEDLILSMSNLKDGNKKVVINKIEDYINFLIKWNDTKNKKK